MIKPGVFLIFAGLILAGVSFAGIAGSAGYPLEISHLLNFIERSGCIFMRNGGEYDSKEARDHIER
ncbi:MAG: DUF5329 domain-containing protein, partial [Gammaproteobacteria bacterium]|nr:DUF5329 domain-containing protein [Gammaproteobacteria bacterium]